MLFTLLAEGEDCTFVAAFAVVATEENDDNVDDPRRKKNERRRAEGSFSSSAVLTVISVEAGESPNRAPGGGGRGKAPLYCICPGSVSQMSSDLAR